MRGSVALAALRPATRVAWNCVKILLRQAGMGHTEIRFAWGAHLLLLEAVEERNKHQQPGRDKG